MAKKAKAPAPSLAEQQAYYDKLMAHDWDFRYSDSRSVFERGSANEAVLRDERERVGKLYEKMWLAVQKYKDNKGRKPERPA